MRLNLYTFIVANHDVKNMRYRSAAVNNTTKHLDLLLTVFSVCREGVLCMRIVGCGLRVGLGDAELARGAVGILSCSILLERPPFTSLPTLFRPMEEKKRRRKSFGRPSSFL